MNMRTYGNRVSGQDACPSGNGSSAGDSVAVSSYQFAQGQAGFYAISSRRTVAEKLEEFALRKDGRGRAIHTDKQAVSPDFYDRHSEQAQQDNGSQSLESRLARGEL